MSVEEHDFADQIAEIEAEIQGDTVTLKTHGSWIFLDKDDAYALAKHFGLIDEWVSVDCEPEIGQKVLILMEVGGNIERGQYVGDGEFTGNWCSRRGRNQCYKVTHWRPLPQLPKGTDK